MDLRQRKRMERKMRKEVKAVQKIFQLEFLRRHSNFLQQQKSKPSMIKLGGEEHGMAWHASHHHHHHLGGEEVSQDVNPAPWSNSGGKP